MSQNLRLFIVIIFMVIFVHEVGAENNSNSSTQTKEGTKEEYKDGLQDIGGGFKKVGIVTGKFFDRALDKVRLSIKNSFQDDGLGSKSGNQVKTLKKDKAIEEDLSETETPVNNQSKQAINNNSDLIGTE